MNGSSQSSFRDPCATPSIGKPSSHLILRLSGLHVRVQSNRQEYSLMTVADIAAAAAHDRRHDVPQHVAEHPEDLRPRRRELQHYSIGAPPTSSTFEDVRDYRLHLISRGLKATTRSIRSWAPCGSSMARRSGKKDVAEQIPLARKEDTLPAVLARDEVVRFLEGGARSQDADDLHHHLCRRPACLRGRRTHRTRHRQRAHGDPHPPSQRPQGSLRHAVRAIA